MIGLNYPGQFNALRRRYERYLDAQPGATERLLPLPAFENREAERAWRRLQIVVVPEWGGRSLYGGDFAYARPALEAFRKRLHGA